MDDNMDVTVQNYYEYNPFSNNALNLKAKQGILDFMILDPVPISMTKVAISMEHVKVSPQGDYKKVAYFMAKDRQRQESWVDILPAHAFYDDVIFGLRGNLFQRDLSTNRIVTFEMQHQHNDQHTMEQWLLEQPDLFRTVIHDDSYHFMQPAVYRSMSYCSTKAKQNFGMILSDARIKIGWTQAASMHPPKWTSMSKNLKAHIKYRLKYPDEFVGDFTEELKAITQQAFFTNFFN